MPNSSIPNLKLKPGRERSALLRHPWIFSGALADLPKGLAEGMIVSVSAQDGECVGLGHYLSGTIAVKLFSFTEVTPDQDFWTEKIKAAGSLRRELGLLNSAETTAYRLINSEGDSLPGLIVDLYGCTAVIQFHSPGMAQLKDAIVTGLKDTLGDKLDAVFVRPEEEGGEGEYAFGQSSDSVIQENGLKFSVNWETGQKTGFFLDQRDNRALVSRYAAGRDVLNCFSYTAGFSVYALRGEAKKVVSVDSSKAALQLGDENIALNFEDANHQSHQADCLNFLKELQTAYDLIILDPPAFIKHRGAVRGGIKGYESINLWALQKIAPGGILFTFSCSQLLERLTFKEILAHAAVRAERRVQVLHELSAAPCHPVSINHPEGEYLKGLVLRVD